MKNYKQIPFSRIKNIESYVEKKLKAGHVIIQILVNEDKKEIDELISYANDKECQSYFRSLTDSEKELGTYVIEERLEPNYAFKGKNREDGICDIDIQTDSQNVIDFNTFKKQFKDMEKYYSSNSFRFEEYSGNMHYEFYLSTGKGDIGNFGGCMEIDFVTEWMEEQGYYRK